MRPQTDCAAQHAGAKRQPLLTLRATTKNAGFARREAPEQNTRHCKMRDGSTCRVCLSFAGVTEANWWFTAAEHCRLRGLT